MRKNASFNGGLRLRVLNSNVRLSQKDHTPQMVHTHGRFWEIDAMRGVAVVMMVIYHLMYDLYLFRITDAIFTAPFWFYFQRVTASTFIALAGVSLAVLAQRAAVQGSASAALFGQNFRRGLRIFGWGLVITFVTRIALGAELAITFGILHFLGVAIVLSYPFLYLRWLNLGTGLLVYAIGLFLRQQAFDLPYLIWLGFEPENHVYVDYFPIFPWFGVLLIGIFVGNSLYAGWQRCFAPPDMLEWWSIRHLERLGRHSLPIYLLHQPVLLAVLAGLLWLLGTMVVDA